MDQVRGRAVQPSDQPDAAGDEVQMGGEARDVVGARPGREDGVQGHHDHLGGRNMVAGGTGENRRPQHCGCGRVLDLSRR